MSTSLLLYLIHINVVFYLFFFFFCPDFNECEVANLCEHNGTCINNNGSYICNCTDGWQGQHCKDGKQD